MCFFIEINNLKEFNFIPRTFVLPTQYEMAKKVIEKYDYSWIRKPWGKSSGRGIEVLDKSKILKKEKGFIISRCVICIVKIKSKSSILDILIIRCL